MKESKRKELEQKFWAVMNGGEIDDDTFKHLKKRVKQIKKANKRKTKCQDKSIETRTS
jgi:hypothetical protein